MGNGILLYDGKYFFYRDDDGVLKCLRYGEPWRGFPVDNALNHLFDFAMACAEEIDRAGLMDLVITKLEK